jgi:hypothetical protein
MRTSGRQPRIRPSGATSPGRSPGVSGAARAWLCGAGVLLCSTALGCLDGSYEPHPTQAITREPRPGNGILRVFNFGPYSPEQTIATEQALVLEPTQPTYSSYCVEPDPDAGSGCVTERTLTLREVSCEGLLCTAQIDQGPSGYGPDRVRVMGYEAGTARLEIEAAGLSEETYQRDAIPLTFAEPEALSIRQERPAVSATYAVFPGTLFRWYVGVQGKRDGLLSPLIVSPDGYSTGVEEPALTPREAWQMVPEPTSEPYPVSFAADAVGTGRLTARHGELSQEVAVRVVDPGEAVSLELRSVPRPNEVELFEVTDDAWLGGPAVSEILLEGEGDERVLAVIVTLADGTEAIGGFGALTVGPLGVVQSRELDGEGCGDPLACGFVVLSAMGPGRGVVEGALGKATLRVPVEVRGAASLEETEGSP